MPNAIYINEVGDGESQELHIQVMDAERGPKGEDGAIQYRAGEGISIQNNVISATGGGGDAVWGEITGTLSNQTDLNTALNAKQNKLTAGSNVTISGNTISATDTTYTAGDNITITGNTISATGTNYIAGNAITIAQTSEGDLISAAIHPSHYFSGEGLIPASSINIETYRSIWGKIPEFVLRGNYEFYNNAIHIVTGEQYIDVTGGNLVDSPDNATNHGVTLYKIDGKIGLKGIASDGDAVFQKKTPLIQYFHTDESEVAYPITVYLSAGGYGGSNYNNPDGSNITTTFSFYNNDVFIEEISSLSGSTSTKTVAVTVPSNATHIMVQVKVNEGSELDIHDYKISLGLTNINYTEWQKYEPAQTFLIELNEYTGSLARVGDHFDRIYKNNNGWYLHKEIGYISSYNGEEINGEYISTTGSLTTGASVYYVLDTYYEQKITNTTALNQLEALANAHSYNNYTRIYAPKPRYDEPTFHNIGSTKVLYYSAEGVAKALKSASESPIYNDFEGTDGNTAGTAGLVPAPATTDAGKFLKADGTWDTAGGGGPTVVQTTGTSQTDVMSQNATTSMIFGDAGTNNKIVIGTGASVSAQSYNMAIGTSASGNGTQSTAVGYSAKARPNGTALGYNAQAGTTASQTNTTAIGQSAYGGGDHCTAVGDNTNTISSYSTAVGASARARSERSVAIGASATVENSPAMAYSVALGANAVTTRAGEVNVGTGASNFGYNSTAYRVIGGVHDGQDLHDAATVAQGNTLATSAPTTSTVGVLGQLWTDTTNMHTYQCTDTTGGTYTWTQRW